MLPEFYEASVDLLNPELMDPMIQLGVMDVSNY